MWRRPITTDCRELWQHAVVIITDSVARAARDRHDAVALEAGQAGFAICVAVTVALAHVAFASATPITTDCRELWREDLFVEVKIVVSAGAARCHGGALETAVPGLSPRRATIVDSELEALAAGTVGIAADLAIVHGAARVRSPPRIGCDVFPTHAGLRRVHV